MLQICGIFANIGATLFTRLPIVALWSAIESKGKGKGEVYSLVSTLQHSRTTSHLLAPVIGSVHASAMHLNSMGSMQAEGGWGFHACILPMESLLFIHRYSCATLTGTCTNVVHIHVYQNSKGHPLLNSVSFYG